MAERDAPMALHAKTVRMQEKMKEDQVNLAPPRDTPLATTAPRAVGVMDEQFPTASLGAKDKRDEAMMAKLELQQPGQVGYTPFGKLEAKDSDFDWYQKKVAAAEAANFQQWFAKNFDLMSPAQKKRAKELYPEFYKQRKKLIKTQAKNLIKFANLKLTGPEGFDDLYLQYLAETGRLDVGPLQNLLNPESTVTSAWEQQGKFQRGLLSPFRVFGEEAFPATPTAQTTQTRMLQSEAFADRSRNALRPGVQLGYVGGFPPLGPSVAGPAQQFAQVNDEAWWTKLKQQQF